MKELVVVGVFLLLLSLILVNTVPNCNEQDHRHDIERIQACTATCGDRGVIINNPNTNYNSCVCSR
jgi:hypothetical protein